MSPTLIAALERWVAARRAWARAAAHLEETPQRPTDASKAAHAYWAERDAYLALERAADAEVEP